MRLALAALVATFALSGCGHEPDEEAWRADLAAVGVEPADWDGYVEVVTEQQCAFDDMEAYVATGRDAGESDVVMRIDFEHACPDRVDELEDAMAAVDEASATVDRACDVPELERTESQARLAEAMGC